jgi:hypothetical protein
MGALAPRSSAAIGVVVALLVALAAVAYSAKSSTKTKSTTVALPADDAPHQATAKCPAKYRTTGGGFRVGDAGEDLVGGSYPQGGRKWTALASRSGFFSSDSELTVLARCLANRDIGTFSMTTSLPGDENPYGVTAECPRGTKVVGGGIKLADPGDNVLGSFPAGKRKWTAVANRGSALDSEVTAVARCLDGGRVKRKSKTGPLLDDGEPHSFTAKCPKRTKALGGGAEPGPTAASIRGSYPVGKRKWTAIGRVIAPGDIQLTAHVLCLKKPRR